MGMVMWCGYIAGKRKKWQLLGCPCYWGRCNSPF
jgi:hypothetical protein